MHGKDALEVLTPLLNLDAKDSTETVESTDEGRQYIMSTTEWTHTPHSL